MLLIFANVNTNIAPCYTSSLYFLITVSQVLICERLVSVCKQCSLPQIFPRHYLRIPAHTLTTPSASTPDPLPTLACPYARPTHTCPHRVSLLFFTPPSVSLFPSVPVCLPVSPMLFVCVNPALCLSGFRSVSLCLCFSGSLSLSFFSVSFHLVLCVSVCFFVYVSLSHSLFLSAPLVSASICFFFLCFLFMFVLSELLSVFLLL